MMPHGSVGEVRDPAGIPPKILSSGWFIFLRAKVTLPIVK